MGLGRKLKDWNAASAAFERERDAELATGRAAAPGSVAQLMAAVLKVMAVVEAAAGVLIGIAVGREVEGWSRPLGLAAPGWVVILAAVVSALVLYGLAAGLSCLDDIRRNTRRPSTG